MIYTKNIGPQFTRNLPKAYVYNRIYAQMETNFLAYPAYHDEENNVNFFKN